MVVLAPISRPRRDPPSRCRAVSKGDSAEYRALPYGPVGQGAYDLLRLDPLALAAFDEEPFPLEPVGRVSTRGRRACDAAVLSRSDVAALHGAIDAYGASVAIPAADAGGAPDHDSVAEPGAVIEAPADLAAMLGDGRAELPGLAGRATLRRLRVAVDGADTLADGERAVILAVIEAALAGLAGVYGGMGSEARTAPDVPSMSGSPRAPRDSDSAKFSTTH